MNIVMLAEVSACNVIGGAERVLREQAVGLRKMDHRVSIVARAPEDDDRLQVMTDEIAEIRYRADRSSSLGFIWSSVAGSIRAFDRVHSDSPVDAAVIHQSLAGLGPIVRCRKAAGKWVYVCHSLAHEEYLTRNCAEDAQISPAKRLQAWARRMIERFVIRRCDRVIVLSDFMKNRVMEAHGIPPSRIQLIPGAADLVKFTPAADKRQVRAFLGMPPDDILLVAIRNLVPRMGLENLVTAMSAVTRTHPGAVLFIGGQGPLRPDLDALIKSLGLGSVVKMEGFVPKDKLAAYYQCADLVVMPTHALEGFGLVTVEALACATPVLGTPVGATPEILSKLDSRLISESNDHQSLAQSINALITVIHDNPDAWIELGQKGRQLVEAEYNWPGNCAALEAVLEA